VLDNLLVENSASIVLVSGGETIFEGSTSGITVESWAMGGSYTDDTGTRQYLTGYVNPTPIKPSSLIGADGRYYTQEKPLYESIAAGSVIVVTDHGVSNNMSGDQTSAINSVLSGNVGSLIYFPAGIYLVEGTVDVPPGSIIVGEGWSQIMATGSYFENQDDPQVMVRVGQPGQTGSVQIQDMLFTVQGATAGCILMEWNIAQSSQGSAAMWDSHFRVGGAQGSSLQVAECQDALPDSGCNAASMLLHITTNSSGYFENVWAWVADHDLDNQANAYAYENNAGVPLNILTDLSIYAGRGVLIESQGPVWFWGSSSEHSELYNYQLSGAADIMISHMQTETPYYQPEQNYYGFAYPPGQGNFSQDPTFLDCAPSSNCLSSWALRLLNSTEIYIYTAGFYSFFNNFALGCGNQQDCQEHLIETNYMSELWFYNLFTYGAVELVSPAGNEPPPIFFNDSNQSGYTSEVAVFLELASEGAGQLGTNDTGSGDVYIDPTIWAEPQSSRTVDCIPPCTIILPPITLTTPTTISIAPWTTTIEVGWNTTTTITTTISSTAQTITSTYYTAISESTVISIPPVTTTLIPVWNTIISSNVTLATIYPTSSILPPYVIITDNPNPLNQTGVSHPTQTRTVYPPPFPYLTTISGSVTTTSHETGLPSVTFRSSQPSPTCHSGCGSLCHYWCNPCNPFLPPLLGGCTGSDFCTIDCPPGTLPGDDGGGDPNDPDNPDEPDDECSTITTSACNTVCVSTSCTTTCSTVEGCQPSVTDDITSGTPAPYFTGSIQPNTFTEPAAYTSAVESYLMSELLSDSLIATNGSYYSTLPTSSAPTGVSGGGTGTGSSSSAGPTTTVSTVTVVKTLTITTMFPVNTQTGALYLGAVQSLEEDGRGPGLEVSYYNLDYIPARSTADVCSVGWYNVQAEQTPSPKSWNALPTSLSFYTDITYGSDSFMPVASCTYTDTQLRCASDSTVYCTQYTQSVLGCNEGVFGGTATSYQALLVCPVTGSVTETVTYTTESTSTSLTTITES